MQQLVLLLMMSTLALASATAFGDDAPSGRPNQSHKQLMRQCMAEQRAKGTGAAIGDMKKTCEEQIQSYRNHPSATSPETAPHP